MSELYMPDSPNGGYRPLAKTERIVSLADDGELFIVRPDDVHERVVRCKDCKRFAVDQSDHEYRSGWWCHRWNTDMVKPDGFCAWGVAKDGA